jgi:hypothetical protein
MMITADAFGMGGLDHGLRFLAVEMTGCQHQVEFLDQAERSIERGHFLAVAGIERVSGALGIEPRVLSLDPPRLRNVASIVKTQMGFAAHSRQPHDETLRAWVGRGDVAFPTG